MARGSAFFAVWVILWVIGLVDSWEGKDGVCGEYILIGGNSCGDGDGGGIGGFEGTAQYSSWITDFSPLTADHIVQTN